MKYNRQGLYAPNIALVQSKDSPSGEWKLWAACPNLTTAIKEFDPFQRPPARDPYASLAAVIFGVPVDRVTAEMRNRAKTIGYARVYGRDYDKDDLKLDP